jgi:ADP-heptose:LPS heptosyltransferase
MQPQVKKPNTLLLVRLDAIGDYILTHDFFPYVRNSDKYKDYEITLCANISCRSLIEHYDKQYFDKFIWVDRKKFYFNPVYRYGILKEVYSEGFEIAIESTYSREIVFGDSVINMSGAKEKIGCSGSRDGSRKMYRELFTDSYYTKLFPSSESNLFEFIRNKEFFENLLEIKIPVERPSLTRDKTKPVLPGEKYVVVVTGAQEPIKVWNIDNFSKVVRYLLENTDFKIVFTGSSNEAKRGDYIAGIYNSDRILNYCGKTTLPEYAGLVANSRLVVTNDTSAVHVAAAFQVPLVCVVKGTRFGRFHPYPKGIFPNSRFVYPKEIEDRLDDVDYLLKKYRYGSPLHINSIRAEQVIAAIQELNSIL